MEPSDCGCKKNSEENKPCSCHSPKKWIWIAVAVVVLAVGGYYVWRKFKPGA